MVKLKIVFDKSVVNSEESVENHTMYIGESIKFSTNERFTDLGLV